MFSWVKSTAQSSISAAFGTAEPIYGPEALRSVAIQESENPTYELTKEDMTWHALETTSAETQTFYLEADSGLHGIVQVIYSNVANLHITVQLSTKIFYPDGKILWSSKPLTNPGFDDEKYSFYADDIAITLAEDGTSYSVKSVVDPTIFIDLTVTRTAPGFKIGKDGRSHFGTDPLNPWGAIRHVFWPRNKVVGFIKVNSNKIDFGGSALHVMALQGMKPHHAGMFSSLLDAEEFESQMGIHSWKKAYGGPNYSAVMMEFITPPSYGSSTVNVSGIAKEGAMVAASTKGSAAHTGSQMDEVGDWPEPTSARFVWNATTKEGKAVEATIEGPLGDRIDRVDIMTEVPAFIKKLAGGVVGTRPFIYQFSKRMTLKLKIGDEIFDEEGTFFYESTFISE